jgi:hypothetical protein
MIMRHRVRKGAIRSATAVFGINTLNKRPKLCAVLTVKYIVSVNTKNAEAVGRKLHTQYVVMP